MLASATAHSKTRPNIAEGRIITRSIDRAVTATPKKVKGHLFQQHPSYLSRLHYDVGITRLVNSSNHALSCCKSL